MNNIYNDKKNLPIGVFDSGIGGMTVLNKLIDLLPNEDFYFIGDTLNLPYGTKTKEKLEEIISNVANHLITLPVKAIVIACNTATANSHHLKLDIPVIGVIEPTAKKALSISENIMVLATNVTIDSGEYRKVIDENKKDNSSNQFYVKCSEFVDEIEKNNINTKESYKLVYEKLKPYKDEKVDVIILGCTHFGLYENEIKNVFPNATLLECKEPTAEELIKRLDDLNLLKCTSNQQGKIELHLTKEDEMFFEKTKWFNHNISKFSVIKLGDENEK